MIGQLVLVVRATLPTLQGMHPRSGADFALDGVGAVFILITTVVATAAMFQASLQFPAEQDGPHKVSDRQLCSFYTLSSMFILAMYGVLAAQNLGYLWIAVETTTLMSAPLVYFYRTKNSLEATWKYLILCSVGIAFALFGTVLIFSSAQKAGNTLLLGQLMAHGKMLDPRLLKLGFIFCLLGYGTKAGLFPLHNWLPDAHSEAPAPASAMLSGALLNCALVALWRVSQVMVAADQADMVHRLLVPAGAVTVLAAGVMLIRQHDLKRMLAYSSVEHTGLLTLAIGIGAGPVFLLHAINHSMIKVALFLLAGNIFYLYGTKSLNKLHGLLRAAPVWAMLLCAASFAIIGSPPFGMFLSEWFLLRDTFAAGHIWAGITVLIGLTVTFIAILSHIGRVIFGVSPKLEVKLPSNAWSLMPGALITISLLAGIALTPKAMSILSNLTRAVSP